MTWPLRVFSPVVLLAVCGLPLQAQEGGPAARTSRDSVFSAAQVQRGASVFQRACSQCHTREQFRGAAGFVRNWQGRSFLDVFQQLSSTMPNDNPGALPRRDYVDVMTYLLRESGYPEGPRDLPLTESSLKAVRIVPLAAPSGNQRYPSRQRP